MPNLCLGFPKGTMTGKNVFSQTAHFLPEFPVFEEGRFGGDKFSSCVLRENDCLYDYKNHKTSINLLHHPEFRTQFGVDCQYLIFA